MNFTIWIGISAIIVFAGFYIARQRIKRRNSAIADIPVFLVGGDYPSNNGTSDTKLDRTEVYYGSKARRCR